MRQKVLFQFGRGRRLLP